MFDDTESHYIASGASVIDSTDVEDAIRLITRKGYGTAANSRILILANPDEAEEIMGWRAGHESRGQRGPVGVRESGRDPCSGKPSSGRVIFARAY